MPFLVLGCYWYYRAVPTAMVGNLAVANTTQQFASWYQVFKIGIGVGVVSCFLVAIFGALGKLELQTWTSGFALLILLGLFSHFERVREFIRKPYAIGGYLYSNGYRVEDYPLLQKEGVLKHATYSSIKEINDSNRTQAGKEVFMLTCTRCHTLNGINSIRSNLTKMYGTEDWDKNALKNYLSSLHVARSFMPPFPGSAEELDALATYIVEFGKLGDTLPGAQSIGTRLRAPDIQ